jgi:hypothetical protein
MHKDHHAGPLKDVMEPSHHHLHTWLSTHWLHAVEAIGWNAAHPTHNPTATTTATISTIMYSSSFLLVTTRARPGGSGGGGGGGKNAGSGRQAVGGWGHASRHLLGEEGGISVATGACEQVHSQNAWLHVDCDLQTQKKNRMGRETSPSVRQRVTRPQKQKSRRAEARVPQERQLFPTTHLLLPRPKDGCWRNDECATPRRVCNRFWHRGCRGPSSTRTRTRAAAGTGLGSGFTNARH